MSVGKKVFIIGPGFIGWNVLDLLIAEGYAVTGLVRRDAHAQGIEKSGATAIKGDLHDHYLIAKHTSESDITIHTATADDIPSVKAVLDGIKHRAAAGKPSVYIHTSGTSVLDDGANGEYGGEKIYHDDKIEEIDSVPDDAPHRQIDLEIVGARKEIGELAKIVIMIPPEIYGFNPAHRRLTIQFPTIARFALKHKWAPYVGQGLALESQIHVLDLARAYIVVLHWLERTSGSEVLQNPYFFCENGKEFQWKEVADEIAKSLHGKGLLDSPTSKTVPKELWNDLFADFTGAVIGLNSRSRAKRLRNLGWQPREKSLFQSWNDDELPELLLEEGLGTRSAYAGTVAS